MKQNIRKKIERTAVVVFDWAVFLTTAAILFTIVSTVFTGCSTLKKDQSNLVKIQMRNPQLLHIYCATTYPITARPGKPDTTFIPVENKNLTDSLATLNKRINAVQNAKAAAIAQTITANDTACYKIVQTLQKQIDNLKSYAQDLQDSYVPCAPEIRWITITDTLPDLAAQAVLQDKLDKQALDNNSQLKEIAALNKAVATRNYIIIGLLLLAGIGFLIKKFFLK